MALGSSGAVVGGNSHTVSRSAVLRMGTSIVDFGAFPGKSDASVVITGQPDIEATSVVKAWLRLAATDDHTADEHLVETIRVFAGAIVAGTGFTIYAVNDGVQTEPLEPVIGRQDADSSSGERAQQATRGGIGTRVYGKWAVAWMWA